MVDEKRIAHLMKTLDLTREEVLAMLADDAKVDKGAKINSLTPEQEAVAKKMRQADRTPTLYKWDTKKRERKPNELKREIIDDFYTFLLENWPETQENAEIKNIEREITFDLGGESFSLTLVQHRKPKN